MFRNVYFLSQRQAEKIEGRKDIIVVSIHALHRPPRLLGSFADVLHLSFDDHDPERDGMDALQEKFSVKHADALKSWLEPYLQAHDTFHLLVHCHAGISRSAAIAWWMHHAYGAKLRTTYPPWYLNRHVLRVLDRTIKPPPMPVDAPQMPPPRDLELPPNFDEDN